MLSSLRIYIIASLIVLGLSLRMAQYFANRSLWLDEASLALNITDRSFAGLIQPLDYYQGAPVGFLLVEKLISEVFGYRDYILRLLPLLAGTISLFLMYKLASLYAKGTAIFVAVGLFAVSEYLVYYSSEVKQYSVDVAVCLLLLVIIHKYIEAETNFRDAVVLGVVGAVSLWLSHPALFSLASIALGLAVNRLVRKDRSDFHWLALAFFLWAASFGVLYLVSLRNLARNDVLLDFWRSGFMPVPPWRDTQWLVNAFDSMLRNPVGLSAVQPGALIFAIGVLSIFLRKREYGLMLFLPLPFVLLASGLHKYPFLDRMLLFTVPLVLLFLAEGTERIRQLLKAVPLLSISVSGAIALILILTPLSQATENLLNPSLGEHVKPAMAYLKANRQDKDLIYVYYGVFPAFEYYAPFYGFGPQDYFSGTYSRADPQKYLDELGRLRGIGRAWFFFSHVYRSPTLDEKEFILEYLDRVGTRLDEFEAPGVSVFLYDLEPTP
jgi:hypothetical protein